VVLIVVSAKAGTRVRGDDGFAGANCSESGRDDPDTAVRSGSIAHPAVRDRRFRTQR
jgi:hypothetical protein